MLSYFWFAIGASALWGLSYVISETLLTEFNSPQLLWYNSTIVCIILSAHLIITNQCAPTVIKFFDYKHTYLILVYPCLYLTASLLILKSIHIGNASLAAIIEASYPLFTLLFAYLIFQKIQFNFGVLVGLVFILTGIYIVNLFSTKILSSV